MIQFKDQEAAARGIVRLSALAGQDVGPAITTAMSRCARPDAALANLERWAIATSNPSLHLEQVVHHPSALENLLTLLGASQVLSDALVQNPELATLVTEPGSLPPLASKEQIIIEGRRLLASATSQSHALDRLRYLKQRHTLSIVLRDIGGRNEQEAIWWAISDLADALVQLCLEVLWPPFAESKELDPVCPIVVVAYGKLGGHELNYSSDIDLVYMTEQPVDERTDRHLTRFCEILGRALSDRMGRGFLYRVDLRLRPYGGAGPILRSLGSVESYYRLYAEPWEVQALLRSRPVAGPDVSERWQILVDEIAYKRKVSDIALEEMVKMRRRVEEGAEEGDLKRGVGGIRDAEFLTQILQVVHGHARPRLRTSNTCLAIRELERENLLEPPVAKALLAGYTFLRKLEHRLQVIHDQQTHTLPTDPESLIAIAKLMACASPRDLVQAFQYQRRTIAVLYRSSLNIEASEPNDRQQVVSSVGHYGPALLQWFDVMPEAEAFYRSLCDNESSLDRVRSILSGAPALVSNFKDSVPLTEMLLSGEIEESYAASKRLRELPIGSTARTVALVYARGRAALCAHWALTRDFNLSRELSDLADALVEKVVEGLECDLTVIALGSYGNRDLGPASDLDLLFMTDGEHAKAELGAQKLLAVFKELPRYGAPVEIDLRLRPEGGKGLLVRTFEGLTSYANSSMEMWERFALGNARIVVGNPAARELVLDGAYGLPLSEEKLHELVLMKKRIESERLQPQHIWRDVKLGHGSLNDVEWLVHLQEMRFPTATQAGTQCEIYDRIGLLGHAHLLHALETEALRDALRHLQEVRNRIDLLDLPDRIVPENPDRLERLALATGFTDGNAFLRTHQEITQMVRSLFEQCLERLQA